MDEPRLMQASVTQQLCRILTRKREIHQRIGTSSTLQQPSASQNTPTDDVWKATRVGANVLCSLESHHECNNMKAAFSIAAHRWLCCWDQKTAHITSFV